MFKSRYFLHACARIAFKKSMKKECIFKLSVNMSQSFRFLNERSSYKAINMKIQLWRYHKYVECLVVISVFFLKEN